MSTVAIAHDEDIARAIEQALSLLTIADLVRGRLVAIKPNDTWATPGDISGVTHGDTLQAVIRHVKRFGPRRLVVTGGYGEALPDPARDRRGPSGDDRDRTVGGKPVETGLAIASRDFVSADTVGARLLGFRPEAVPHIEQAARIGLGQSSPIDTRGLTLDEAVRIFTKVAYGVELRFKPA